MLDKAPNKKLSDLLERLGAALAAGEIEKAVACFEDDCYWRDLVAFTWNIKTLEGRDQIRDMLESQLAKTEPSGWAASATEDATEADGVLEGSLDGRACHGQYQENSFALFCPSAGRGPYLISGMARLAPPVATTRRSRVAVQPAVIESPTKSTPIGPA